MHHCVKGIDADKRIEVVKIMQRVCPVIILPDRDMRELTIHDIEYDGKRLGGSPYSSL